MPSTDASRSDDVTPRHLDTAKASIARVYDAALGGKDNYEVDREVVRRLPGRTGVRQFTWDHRNFSCSG